MRVGLSIGANAPTIAEIPYFFGVGLCGAVAQWLYATALKYTPAAIVAVTNYSSIVWATLFGWLVWSEWPLPLVFVGAAVVIGSNILIVWRETRLKKSMQDNVPNVT